MRRETTVFEFLGIAGISIGVLPYVPQVVHLGREHCSVGVSALAWAVWLTSSLLIGALALDRQDPVFIALEAGSLASAAMIVLLLTYRYRLMTCEAHAHARVDGGAGHGAAEPDAGIPAATRP